VFWERAEWLDAGEPYAEMATCKLTCQHQAASTTGNHSNSANPLRSIGANTQGSGLGFSAGLGGAKNATLRPMSA